MEIEDICMNELPHLVDRYKLAIAVAIIRNKPEGVTAEEYAQQLADSYQQQQLNSQQKLQQLEQQLLLLKQQLCLQKVSGDDKKGEDGSAMQDTPDSDEDSGQMLESLMQESEDGESSESDDSNGATSHPRKKETNASETPAESMDFLLTPPDENEPSEATKKQDARVRSSDEEKCMKTDEKCELSNFNLISINTAFLQSVCGLRSIVNVNGDTLMTEYGQTIIDTVKSSLRIILEVFREKNEDKRISASHLNCALESVLEVSFGVSDKGKEASRIILSDLCKFVKDLLLAVMEENEINQYYHQQLLCDSIIQLAKSANLLHCIITSITRHIQTFAHKLKVSVKLRQQDQLDTNHFENMGYILHILKSCLMKHRENHIDLDVLAELKCELDDTLLPICESFPLYGFFVWEIGSLIIDRVSEHDDDRDGHKMEQTKL